MIKNIFAFFFIFSTCLLFAANKRIPEWITLPTSVYPSDIYMNGTGSGINRETAELDAVRNLSSVFGQTVKSNNVASKKWNKLFLPEKFLFLQQKISSRI